jgi:hypothetical protein
VAPKRARKEVETEESEPIENYRTLEKERSNVM